MPEGETDAYTGLTAGMPGFEKCTLKTEDECKISFVGVGVAQCFESTGKHAEQDV